MTRFQKVGWKDGCIGAQRRHYKYGKWQAQYNRGYNIGRSMATHAFAQKIADSFMASDIPQRMVDIFKEIK